MFPSFLKQTYNYLLFKSFLSGSINLCLEITAIVLAKNY